MKLLEAALVLGMHLRAALHWWGLGSSWGAWEEREVHLPMPAACQALRPECRSNLRDRTGVHRKMKSAPNQTSYYKVLDNLGCPLHQPLGLHFHNGSCAPSSQALVCADQASGELGSDEQPLQASRL